MASTDAKSGFRLPWSTDRNDSTDPAAEAGDQTIDEAPPQGAVGEGVATPETAPAEVTQDQGSAAAPRPRPRRARKHPLPPAHLLRASRTSSWPT